VEDEDDETDDCIELAPANPTEYPQPSDVPDWGQTPVTGGKCDWSGSVQDLVQFVDIAIDSGSDSFTINIFELLHVGPANRISMDGAAIQAYAVQVTGFSTSNTPSSPGASSSKNFINFDVPQNPLASNSNTRTQERSAEPNLR
jgi:hypothetical protein